MPGQTPVYGIRYPTIDDTITPAVFKNFADDVDAVITATQAQATAALNRKMCLLPVVVSSATFVQNVESSVSFTNTPFINPLFPTNIPFRDNDNMFSAGSPTNITINTAGIYMIETHDISISGFATIVSFRLMIYKNGLFQWGERRNENNGASNSLYEPNQGLLRCSVGDVITVRLFWQGTGGPASVANSEYPFVAVYRICAI